MTNQTQLDRFLKDLCALEARNNRTDADYSARFWARTEDGRRHVAVYECAEYRHGDRVLERAQGAGRILCFIEKATGNVVAPRNTGRVAPGHVLLGNIGNEDGGLGGIQGRLKVYSDEDHAYLGCQSLRHLNAVPGEMVDVGSSKHPRL